jgi:hypothetical protein
MEHISRPEAAFTEISRVAADEGFIYVVSAPLWHSRQGHHKSDIFDVDRYPWIHLRLDEETLLRLCDAGDIEYARRIDDVAAEIKYMMSSEQLNRRPARDYVQICSELKGLFIERNHLDLEPVSVLEMVPHEARAELLVRAGDAIELLALTHILAAWKLRRPHGDGFARARRRMRRALNDNAVSRQRGAKR